MCKCLGFMKGKVFMDGRVEDRRSLVTTYKLINALKFPPLANSRIR